MPKTLPSNVATEVAKQYGTKPIFLVEIDWGGSIGIRTYSDTIYVSAETRIINIGNLSSITKISGGSTGNISITLDDNDGALKTIIDSTDIHKRPCNLYIVYDTTDRALLFGGQLSTPLSWTDHPRQLSFNIIAKIEDEEIGFSPEQHAFPYIADSAIGVAWPLVFGNVVRYPVVKATENIRGTCLTRYNVISPGDMKELYEAALDYARALRTKEIADSGEILRRKQISADLDYEIQEVTQQDYVEILNDLSSAYGQFLQTIDEVATRAFNLVYYIRDFAWQAFRDEYYRLILEEMQRTLVYLQTQIFTLTEQTIPELEKEIIEERKAKNPDLFKINKLKDEILKHRKTIELYQKTIYGDSGNTSTPDEENFGVFLGYLYDDDTPGLIWYITQQQNLYILSQQNLAIKQAALMQFYLTQIEIDGGEEFPQGVPTDILINEARFRGIFSGRTFTIEAAFLATDSNIEIDTRLNNQETQFWLKDSSYLLKDKFVLIRIKTDAYETNKIIFVHEQVGRQCSFYTIMWAPVLNGTQASIKLDSNCLILETCPILPNRWITGTDDISAILNLPDISWGLEIGDTVYLAEDYKDIYVVALNEIDEIVEVLARRTINGVSKLVPIPSRYYTKNLAYTIGNQTVSVLIFPRPLVQYTDENWNEQVFVSVKESIIGNNTADIIQWLASTYGGITSDTISQEHVHDALVNYPSNFVLLERRNVLEVIEDIAEQARCAVFIAEGKLYYKYLSEEVESVQTITNDEIEATSLSLTISETDSLVTKYIAEWRRDFAQEKPNEIILRNNIPKYGINELRRNYYIYNIESLVMKSATFWMLRKSNTWKVLSFTGLLPLLKLNPYDTILINLTVASTNPVKGIIEEIGFDMDKLSLTYTIWLPVRAGEMEPYVFAWPATAAPELEYPTPQDLYAGGEWENV